MPIRNASGPLKKLQALARDPEVDLWAADEVHFQQYGSRCRLWVPPENRDPLVWHHPTREGVGYYGAVRLRDGRFVFRREERRFNAETFWAFLRQLRSAGAASGRRLVVVLDNATYHHARLHKAWRLRHAHRFGLEFLPPYSPDLNPAERLWRLTRRRCLHNRYFPTRSSVIYVVEDQFLQWSRGNETLRRLCAII